MITIFTDGSSRGNPGPGGWGTVIVADERISRFATGQKQVTELGGRENHTTNNRMELTAVLKGLEHIAKAKKADNGAQVFTDSSYVINGITKWINGWKRNGWQTKAKEDVLNKDLWMDIDAALEEARSAVGTVSWKYVGGHVGILGNERCDHVATAFADERELKLYDGPLGGYDLPNILDISFDEALQASKKSRSAKAKGPAYSYVSMVNGLVEVHKTWAECEKRVKGAKGARYQKAMNAQDEAVILGDFQSTK